MVSLMSGMKCADCILLFKLPFDAEIQKTVKGAKLNTMLSCFNQVSFLFMLVAVLMSASVWADKMVRIDTGKTLESVPVWVETNNLGNADVDETWYVPGWMRTSEPEELAWNSFTNAFSATENRFRKWNGDQLWPTAVKNADAEAVKLADEISKMSENRRAHLTLVGHSLGGRIVARALAKLSLDGVKINWVAD